MAEKINDNGELPLLSAGQRLREARVAGGLDLKAISSETKIARRHLEAIEQDRFSDLASRTYAIGFSRAYARALALDEDLIADCVRDQLEAERSTRPTSHTEHFEPGDPARVPPSALAWAAGLGFLVAIVVLFLFWRSFVDPAGEIPDLVTEEAPGAQAQPLSKGSPAEAGAQAMAAQGPVVITALEDGVWVKISDGAGAQLFQKEMALGETYTVPAAAKSPVLATARPDALRVSVGGQSMAQLADGAQIVRDVPLDASSLLAKMRAGPTATPTSPAAPALGTNANGGQ